MMREAFDRRRRIAFRLAARDRGPRGRGAGGCVLRLPERACLMGRTIAGRTVTTSLELADVLLDEAKVAVVPRRGLRVEASFRLSYALSDADLEEGIASHRARPRG
jgi:aspartate aminotransferase